MKALLWIVAALVCLPSCSPEKQFAKFLAKHPEFARRDTIHDTVTAIVEYVRYDTVWKVRPDTLKVDRDRLHVRTLVRHDTVWQNAWCDADTIKVPYMVTVEKVVPCPEGYRVSYWWRPWAIGSTIVASMLLLFVGLVIRKQASGK